MQIDKAMILNLIRSKLGGSEADAEAAARDLPGTVDTDDAGHRQLLERFGIDPDQLGGLIDKLPGGLGDKLQGGLGKLLG